MIYTVTFNPSIDYIVKIPTVHLGELNRMEEDIKLPGGKGINVSRVLHQLGQKTVTLGFLGGFTGTFIQHWLEKEGIQTNFIEIDQDTRINVKIKADTETEINAAGPAISDENAELLLNQMESLTPEDLVILSGNKPPRLAADFYQQMIKKITATGAEFVIDTTGDEVLHALPAQPLLVKPNHHELADMYGVTFASIEDMLPYGRKLIESGAKHAIISMAGDGALLFTKDGVYRATAPKGTVKNSVGSGDSMIAGFIGTWVQTKDPIRSFQKGVASGSATAFSNDLATRAEIEALIDQVKINKIDDSLHKE